MVWRLLLLLPLSATAYGGKQPGERQREALRKTTVAVDSSGRSSEVASLVVAAGCFWGVELAFARLPGVISTEVGYIGGSTPRPTYSAVSKGKSGHAEAVRIIFDASTIGLTTLFGVFFDVHDPTTLNRQGNDVGTQYRSAIFYSDERQRLAAQTAIEREAERLGTPLATTLERADTFWPAEDYHQAYLEKGGQSAAKGEQTPIRCYG